MTTTIEHPPAIPADDHEQRADYRKTQAECRKIIATCAIEIAEIKARLAALGVKSDGAE